MQKLPGQLTIYFFSAILIAVAASAVVILLYRRAVLAGMLAKSRIEEGVGTWKRGMARMPTPAIPSTPPELTLVEIDATSGFARETTAYDAAARALQYRLALVYAGAAPVPALATSLLQLYLYGIEGDLSRLIACTGQYLPLVFSTLGAMLVWRPLTVVKAFLLCTLAMCLLVIGVSFVSHGLRGEWDPALVRNGYWFLVLLLVTAPLPFLLLALTGSRRLRAVVPMALTGLLLFMIGPLLTEQAVVMAFESTAGRDVLFYLGHDGFFMAASLPFGYLSWRGIRAVSRAYEAKAFSDQQLLVDSWWVIVVFWIFVFLTAQANSIDRAAMVLLAGLALLIVYRLAIAWGLKRLVKPLSRPPNRRLLLLRVFGFQKRTEQLFDAVGQRWRFHGSVQMIAGTDLAARSIDPGDFVRFLGARMNEQFITGESELQARLSSLDVAPDPDGRYRVNEFFCRDDTWQAALVALLDVSDAVLMDLRGFSPSKQGCLFELKQLVERVPLESVVLVTDSTTDMALLRSTLMSAWEQAVSKGAVRASASLALVNVVRHSVAEVAALIALLLGARPLPRS